MRDVLREPTLMKGRSRSHERSLALDRDVDPFDAA
jgi:hypothetical protein